MTSGRVGRGAFALGQAAVFSGLAGLLSDRSLGLTACAGVAAVAQVAAAGGVWRRRADVVRVAGVVSLLAVAVVIGAFVQVAVHLMTTFGTGNREIGAAILAGAVAAAPWFVAVPIVQIVRPGRAVGAAVAVVAVGLLPLIADAARVRAFVAPDAVGVARWLVDRAGPPPDGAGPYVIAALRDGEVVGRVVGEGDLAAALVAFPPLPAEGGVVVELVVAEGPLRRVGWLGGAPLRPGDGLRGPNGRRAGVEVWRRGVVEDAAGLGIPVAGPLCADATSWARADVAVADATGARPLRATWSVPPDVTAAALRDAAAAGARMLARYQRADGRFAYVVRGEDGQPGKGYQWTRHAGTAWFVAAAAAATGDEALRTAARVALRRIDAEVRRTTDGRAWVDDPLRKDGDAWIGNTALTFLAWNALGENPERQAEMAAFLASTVGPDGQIRGVMHDHDERFAPQKDSSYAAGQGLLALIVADAAGYPVRDALDRASAWVDGAYWPVPVVVTLDEHWMCLARAAARARGRRVGDRLCEAYLAQGELVIPFGDGATFGPNAGGVAAHLEAVVAGWDVDRRDGRASRWEGRSRQLGGWMLANGFRAEDGPLLPVPAVIGGLRDTPWRRDVRIDAVQHAGFGMLGLAERLDGR